MVRFGRIDTRLPRWLVGAGFVLLAAGAFFARGCWEQSRRESPVDMRAVIEQRADSLDAALVALGDALNAGHGGPADVRAAFRAARAQYKRVEGILEFYAPALAAAFNSRRQEVDDDDAPPPSTLAAAGFPALETLVWPNVEPHNSVAAQKIV